MFGGKQCRLKKIIKDWPGAHVEVARNALASWDYCGKEDTRTEGPVEYGTPPAQRNCKGDTKKRNALLLEMGVAKAVEEGHVCLIQAPKLKCAIDLLRSLQAPPPTLDALDNYWFVGQPGTGKSRGAR